MPACRTQRRTRPPSRLHARPGDGRSTGGRRSCRCGPRRAASAGGSSRPPLCPSHDSGATLPPGSCPCWPRPRPAAWTTGWACRRAAAAATTAPWATETASWATAPPGRSAWAASALPPLLPPPPPPACARRAAADSRPDRKTGVPTTAASSPAGPGPAGRGGCGPASGRSPRRGCGRDRAHVVPAAALGRWGCAWSGPPSWVARHGGWPRPPKGEPVASAARPSPPLLPPLPPLLLPPVGPGSPAGAACVPVPGASAAGSRCPSGCPLETGCGSA